jgi:hypothetical protein
MIFLTCAAWTSVVRVIINTPDHLSGLIARWTDGLDAGERCDASALASAINAGAHADWASNGERLTATCLPDGRIAFGVAPLGGGAC